MYNLNNYQKEYSDEEYYQSIPKEKNIDKFLENFITLFKILLGWGTIAIIIYFLLSVL